MNKEELKRECESLSNLELLYIVNNKIRYNVQVVTAAQIELRNRAIPKEEVKKHKEQLAREAKIITGNIDDDLGLPDKILFFIFFLPQLHYLVRRSYRKQNYVLKLRQAGYYSLLGCIFCMLIFILGIRRLQPVNCFILWFLSFLPTYAFDRYFYKERTIRRLRIKAGDPEESEKNKI